MHGHDGRLLFFNVAVFGVKRGVAVVALGTTLGTVTLHSTRSPEEGEQLVTSAVAVSCPIAIIYSVLDNIFDWAGS